MAFAAQGREHIKWFPTAHIVKYSAESVRELVEFYLDEYGVSPDGAEIAWHGIEPYDVEVVKGNLLTTAGLNRMTNLITGGGGAGFTSAQGFAGVGDSSTAATVADTQLNAATNKWYRPLDAGYPLQANGTITAYTTFGGSEANYVWNEWVWGIATGVISAQNSLPGTSPIILNHKVQSMNGGTAKTFGSIWVLQATATLS